MATAPAFPPEAIAYQQARIHENLGPRVIAVASVLLVLDVAAVIGRFFARYSLKVRLGWDDWLILPGLAMIACMVVEVVYSVKFGLGKHQLATDPTQGYKILMIGFYLSITYTLAHWFIKMSILLLYARIFTLHMKWFKYCIYGTMAYVTAWALSLFFVVVGQCQPLNYFWERYNITKMPPAQGKCTVDTSSSQIGTSVTNTVADFAVLLLPIAVLVPLQLNLAKKVALVSVFMVGTLACAGSIARLYYTTKTLSDQTDVSFHAANTYLWTVIEASVGILCACFPIIGPLFKTLRTKAMSKGASGASSRQQDSSGTGTIGSRTIRSKKNFQELPEEELTILDKSQRPKSGDDHV